MALSTVLLSVFLLAAQAQTPRSPVRAAISSAATAQPLSEAIQGLDADGRVKALEGLDRLERAVLDAEGLAELSEAYRLLGRPADALTAARVLSEKDVNSAAGDAQAILALAQAGDYPAAQAAAEAGLARFPSDRSLLALFHQVKGRGASTSQSTSARVPQQTVTAAANDNRQSAPVLRVMRRKAVPSLPAIEAFHLSNEEAGAPQATLWDRLVALITPDDRLIEGDLSLLRSKAQDFNLPPETYSLATTSPEVPRQFVQWLKTMRSEDLPPIEYGIVSPGDFAEFRKGLGRGKIVMSHFIRDAEPEARSTVLMHELFHYWDMKIARNSYQTETYGFSSPENEGDREYDPYLLTAHFWKHVRPKDAASSMAKSFDRLPLEADGIRRKVDAMIDKKRSKKE